MKDYARTQSKLDLIADAGITAMEKVTESAEKGMIAAFDAMVAEASDGNVLVQTRMYDKEMGTWSPWRQTDPFYYNPKGTEGTRYICQFRRFTLVPLDPPKEKTA